MIIGTCVCMPCTQNINNEKRVFFFSFVNVSGLAIVASACETKFICGCYRGE